MWASQLAGPAKHALRQGLRLSEASNSAPAVGRIHRVAVVNSQLPSSKVHSFSTSTAQYKKRNDVNEPPRDVVDDVPVARTKGKGAKGMSNNKTNTKSKRGDKEQAIREDSGRNSTSTTNAELPGENYDEPALKEHLTRMLARCRETISKMIASHGRADPALLDNVRVSVPAGNNTDAQQSRTASGPTYSLKEFATVGVRDGALIVTCFDPDSVKHVERAIYQLGNGLAPQQVPGNEAGVLRVPVPRPTAETRKTLAADVNRVCENARSSIRTARQNAQKQIREDIKKRVVSSDEGHRELGKMEDLVKKQTAELDQLEKDMRKRIEI